ncbi:MAG: hypothetical protein LQ350_001366 [Teloschistes chrysophthalmus]|nr:MAG: hypothetical protein LQ350_001366 [Niorma chrysophthalma]
MTSDLPRFLELPGELRNKIYRNLLVADSSGLRLLQDNEGAHGGIVQTKPKRWYDVHVPILRTCKQINNEASSFFREDNTFVMVDYAVDHPRSALRTFAPGKTVLDLDAPRPETAMTISLKGSRSDKPRQIRRIYMAQDIELISYELKAYQLRAPGTQDMQLEFNTHGRFDKPAINEWQRSLLTYVGRDIQLGAKTLRIDGSVSPAMQHTLDYLNMPYHNETPLALYNDLGRMLAMARLSQRVHDRILVTDIIDEVSWRFHRLLSLPHLSDPKDSWTYNFRVAMTSQDPRAKFDPLKYWVSIVKIVLALVDMIDDPKARKRRLKLLNSRVLSGVHEGWMTKPFADLWELHGLLDLFP